MDNLSDLQAKALEMAKEKGFLSVAQVATLVGKSIRAVREDCNRLGCYEKTDKTGYMIPPEDIEKFIRQRKPPKKQQTKPLPVEESDLKGSLIAGIGNEANKMTSPIVATATEKIKPDATVEEGKQIDNWGWIFLHRSIKNWDWFKRPLTRIVFVYLLLEANYSDRLYDGRITKRGCLTTGRKKIALENGISERAVRTALENLEITGEIEMMVHPSRQYSIIKIVNYEKYQHDIPNAQKATKKTLQRHTSPTEYQDPHHTIEEIEQAKETLDYFNQLAHHNYRGTENNLNPIIKRLREGETVENLKEYFDEHLEDIDEPDCTRDDPETHLKRLFGNEFDLYRN